jgi:hypothetical protein
MQGVLLATGQHGGMFKPPLRRRNVTFTCGGSHTAALPQLPPPLPQHATTVTSMLLSGRQSPAFSHSGSTRKATSSATPPATSSATHPSGGRPSSTGDSNPIRAPSPSGTPAQGGIHSNVDRRALLTNVSRTSTPAAPAATSATSSALTCSHKMLQGVTPSGGNRASLTGGSQTAHRRLSELNVQADILSGDEDEDDLCTVKVRRTVRVRQRFAVPFHGNI